MCKLFCSLANGILTTLGGLTLAAILLIAYVFIPDFNNHLIMILVAWVIFKILNWLEGSKVEKVE